MVYQVWTAPGGGVGRGRQRVGPRRASLTVPAADGWYTHIGVQGRMVLRDDAGPAGIDRWPGTTAAGRIPACAGRGGRLLSRVPTSSVATLVSDAKVGMVTR